MHYQPMVYGFIRTHVFYYTFDPGVSHHTKVLKLNGHTAWHVPYTFQHVPCVSCVPNGSYTDMATSRCVGAAWPPGEKSRFTFACGSTLVHNTGCNVLL